MENFDSTLGFLDEGSDCGSVHGSARGCARGRDRECDLPDLVDSDPSDLDDSDDDEDFSPPRLATVTPSYTRQPTQSSPDSPTGPPPPRVSGPAFSPSPMNVSQIFPFYTSPSPSTIRVLSASLISPGGLDRDEREAMENISTVTVDDDDLVSLRLVLTPTQDSQGLGQPGISSPPLLPLTPAAAPNSRTPILQGGGPVVAPGPQPRASVQLGGAGTTPRRAALQGAAQQGAGFGDRHPAPHNLPPSPGVPPNASPSQNLQPPADDPPSQPI